MRRVLVLAVVLAGCGKNPLMAEVDGVTLPECDDVVPAAPGPIVAVSDDTHEEDLKLPADKVVRIAAERSVSWRRVKQLAARVAKQGSSPVLLVGRGISSDVGAFEPVEALHGGKHLTLNATRDGKFCLGHPDSDQLYCVQGHDRTHIARTFVRETLSAAVKQYGLHDVEVTVDPGMNWADMIRAVDGARTCCEGVAMRATLVD
jgi:hypothetical protein